MKKRKYNWLLIMQGTIIVWAIPFLFSFLIIESDKPADALAIGNVAGLFISIPLAIISFAARANGRISDQYAGVALVFSVLNILIGIADWLYVIMLMRMP